MRYFRLAAAFSAATVLVLSMAARPARADVQMYSFEPGDSPNALDGFSNLSGNILSNTTAYGVTSGTQALQIDCNSPSFAGSATASIQPIMNSATVTGVSLDATIPSGEQYAGGYLLLGITLYDNSASSPYDGDGFQVAGSDEQSIYQATGNGVPQHVVIPLTGSDPITFNPTTYPQLVAAGWVTTGFEIFEDKNSTETLAVDNVSAVVVPEPASLAFGTVGGLMLLARRRRTA